jgi:cysteinyl-tRNA synthetase
MHIGDVDEQRRKPLALADAEFVGLLDARNQVCARVGKPNHIRFRGLRLQEKKGSADADGFINLLVEIRAEVRKQKLWAMSDLIRVRLKELGVTIEDTKDGTTWRWF